jgi:hypothetical protein
MDCSWLIANREQILLKRINMKLLLFAMFYKQSYESNIS